MLNGTCIIGARVGPLHRYVGCIHACSCLQVKEGSISICLIDDCIDADVPLAEVTFSDLYILHRIYPHGQGKAKFKLIGRLLQQVSVGMGTVFREMGVS